jgi:hypothetical protein
MGVALTEAYNRLTNERRKYGDLVKCEFHIHTPASYDFEGKLFKRLRTVDVINFAHLNGYLSIEQKNILIQDEESGYFSTAERLLWLIRSMSNLYLQ